MSWGVAIPRTRSIRRRGERRSPLFIWNSGACACGNQGERRSLLQKRSTAEPSGAETPPRLQLGFDPFLDDLPAAAGGLHYHHLVGAGVVLGFDPAPALDDHEVALDAGVELAVGRAGILGEAAGAVGVPVLLQAGPAGAAIVERFGAAVRQQTVQVDGGLVVVVGEEGKVEARLEAGEVREGAQRGALKRGGIGVAR